MASALGPGPLDLGDTLYAPNVMQVRSGGCLHSVSSEHVALSTLLLTLGAVCVVHLSWCR
jgi:hypothetical protein